MKISEKELQNIKEEIANVAATSGASTSGIAGFAGEQAAGEVLERGLDAVLKRMMSPAVAARFAGVAAGILVPTELGDGTMTGRFKATLEKYFPDLKEDDRSVMASKIIMYNRLSEKPLLSFPARATIHQLYNTPIEKFESQFMKLKKQPKKAPPAVSENRNLLKMSKSQLKKIIEQELKEIFKEELENIDSVKDPISPSGQMVSREELINDMRDGLELCFTKLEDPNGIDYELVILLGNALKRAQALTGEEYP